MSSWKLLCGDALAELAKLPEQSVQTCITSPPYYGLRDYGVEGQIGLEETPEHYIERLVNVFAGVWRVLRDDGTLWIVIGDSYSNDAKWGGYSGGRHAKQLHGATQIGRGKRSTGCKSKDLIGIPWLLAFALRDAGWYLRQEIIWAKSISGPVYRGGTCMPESVTDRCTRSHETVFMFSKSERYFYDIEAVKEPSIAPRAAGNKQHKYVEAQAQASGDILRTKAGLLKSAQTVYTKRNMRSVWHMNPRAFKGAHFATFPPELLEPMVRAGTSEYGCCSACGAPYTRVVERCESAPDVTQRSTEHYNTAERYGADNGGNSGFDQLAKRMREGQNGTRTVCWKPGCTCGAGAVPCKVLDPFSGAGTTPLVAAGLGRDAIGIELNPEYVALARARMIDAGFGDDENGVERVEEPVDFSGVCWGEGEEGEP